ncbi:MAG: cytidine deaminase [Clostridia bacterium]|nr:cytidine deaminase [Clostridia bacterium]
MDKRELTAFALEARENSYSPYSSFKVGAALLAENGKVYCGCNIENAAYSPTNCAERTAFFTAIADGARGFEAIAVVGGKDEIDSFCLPCGMCRQVMSEFCDKNFRIYTYDGEEIRTYTLGELLPESFKL